MISDSDRSEPRTVFMSPEVMEQFATRDERGNAIRWEWGGPDIAGVYEPTLTVDYGDNLVAQRNRELAEKVERKRLTGSDYATRYGHGWNDALNAVLALIEDPTPSKGGEKS